MEEKSSKELNQKISEYNKEENKFDKLKKGKNRIYFNSVTGELMDSDDGNEADMYEIVPDMDQYSQDNITQYTDICEKFKTEGVAIFGLKLEELLKVEKTDKETV